MMWVVEVFAVDADFRLGAVFVVRGMNFRAVRAGFVVIAGFGGVIKFFPFLSCFMLFYLCYFHEFHRN